MNKSIHIYWNIIEKYVDIKSLFMVYKSSYLGMQLTYNYDMKKLWLLCHNPYIFYMITTYDFCEERILITNCIFSAINNFPYFFKNQSHELFLEKILKKTINKLHKLYPDKTSKKIINKLLVDKINIFYDTIELTYIHKHEKYNIDKIIEIKQCNDNDICKLKYKKCIEKKCEYCDYCNGYGKFLRGDKMPPSNPP